MAEPSVREQLDDLLGLDSDTFRLTEWEVGFVDSLDRQLRAGRALSEKQTARLRQLYHVAIVKGER